MGAFNRSALVTVVERRSRFLLLGDLTEGHDAQAVYACLIELTADLPPQRSTLTLLQRPLDHALPQAKDAFYGDECHPTVECTAEPAPE